MCQEVSCVPEGTEPQENRGAVRNEGNTSEAAGPSQQSACSDLSAEHRSFSKKEQKLRSRAWLGRLTAGWEDGCQVEATLTCEMKGSKAVPSNTRGVKWS